MFTCWFICIVGKIHAASEAARRRAAEKADAFDTTTNLPMD
jgi:hypothetical protein